MKQKRPNILFVIADDASHFGVYGHSFVKTPYIDLLANEGIIFDNAFTTNPKCAPSRACVLTGMHTWQLEEACNHYSIFRNKFIVIPDLLEDSGYFCGLLENVGPLVIGQKVDFQEIPQVMSIILGY